MAESVLLCGGRRPRGLTMLAAVVILFTVNDALGVADGFYSSFDIVVAVFALFSIIIASGWLEGKRWSFTLGLAPPLFVLATTMYQLLLSYPPYLLFFIPVAISLVMPYVTWAYLRRPYVKAFLDRR